MILKANKFSSIATRILQLNRNFSIISNVFIKFISIIFYLFSRFRFIWNTIESVYGIIRKQTFVDKGWNHSISVSADELSKTGFYYTGILDEVECFHCSVCILDWDDNDWGDSVNSMVTHKMISQNCYFLKVKQMEIFLCEKKFINILFD